jgi:AcrR family transcriptional regulator
MGRTAGSEGARTRAAIRDAAVELFARHGYEGVSMRQLADAVGVQAGALYRYHPNKQALLASLMADHMAQLLDAWRAARPNTDDGPTLLEAFVRFHVRYHIDRRDEVFVNYMELRSLEPANAPSVIALRDAYERDLRGILQACLAQRAAPGLDVPLAAMALIAMLTGVTTWRKPGGRLSATQIEDQYVTLALRAVGVSRLETAGERI